MTKRILQSFLLTTLYLGLFIITPAQSSTASISGTVTDSAQAVVSNASVTVRNTGTGFTRTVQTDSEGRYRIANIPIGAYEVAVEAPNFGKFIQTGITLVVNQDAIIDASLKTGDVQETVTITENASVLNTTTAEVSTRFDEKRLSELPIASLQCFAVGSGRKPVNLRAI